MFYRLNWVEVTGTTYKPFCAVVVGYNQDLLTFGQVDEIISVDNKIYLVTQLINTEAFNSYYHAYEVTKTSCNSISEIEDLRDYHPLSIYQSYDTRLIRKFFIPLKYHVLSNVDLQIIHSGINSVIFQSIFSAKNTTFLRKILKDSTDFAIYHLKKSRKNACK